MDGAGGAAPAARTTSALSDLARVLRETAEELRLLADRAETLARAAEAMPLAEAMALEERPLLVSRVVELTDRLHECGGEVRRAEAHQLRGEGLTQEAIAALFGVSRQRAGALLKALEEPRRAPKRPRPRT